MFGGKHIQGAQRCLDNSFFIPDLIGVMDPMSRYLDDTVQGNMKFFGQQLQFLSIDGRDVVTTKCTIVEGNQWSLLRSDKNIKRGSPTILLALGGVREVHCGDDLPEAFVLNAGDALVLSWQDSVKLDHDIVSTMYESKVIRSPADAIAPRITFVYRQTQEKMTARELRKRAERKKRSRHDFE